MVLVVLLLFDESELGFAARDREAANVVALEAGEAGVAQLFRREQNIAQMLAPDLEDLPVAFNAGIAVIDRTGGHLHGRSARELGRFRDEAHLRARDGADLQRDLAARA